MYYTETDDSVADSVTTMESTHTGRSRSGQSGQRSTPQELLHLSHLPLTGEPKLFFTYTCNTFKYYFQKIFKIQKQYQINCMYLNKIGQRLNKPLRTKKLSVHFSLFLFTNPIPPFSLCAAIYARQSAT